MTEFTWPLRVYYEDTDSGGVVYYANYLKFMERARTEWLRSYGIEQDRLIRDQGVMFAVRAVRLEFLKPARFNDRLRVSVHVLERGRASLTFEQDVRRDGEQADTLCTASVRIACLDATSFRPRPIPEHILGVITREC
ncbi:MAG: tol-pal system-associated acyl-CoA thioesterase [Gammaproteobacteria bacterium]|nr:tol-pal system-associated acyl-CoA thioesterase [Gammaproteobacteria bacterium]NIR97816.1 tol-pal system-associated acyl-CoA thioesterase [Gammaproteobacteria bacterium]NIT63516.1 tol-pal system-associated acyl-CoA thioesterase [Gammaproteobacteria bacterium]NIV20463.1 tol-pal system-associated acyl-CoA thioesterase [Gammaproteobacteria bacterium]NIX11045.1 tol-pal system-associated acyl-CoA thioesterase [Gammaproteobacteria bacterium]